MRGELALAGASTCGDGARPWLVLDLVGRAPGAYPVGRQPDLAPGGTAAGGEGDCWGSTSSSRRLQMVFLSRAAAVLTAALLRMVRRRCPPGPDLGPLEPHLGLGGSGSTLPATAPTNGGVARAMGCGDGGAPTTARQRELHEPLTARSGHHAWCDNQGRVDVVSTRHSLLRPWPATEGVEAAGRRRCVRSVRVMRTEGTAGQGGEGSPPASYPRRWHDHI